MSSRPKWRDINLIKKVIAKRKVGLRPTDQTKMSQCYILSVLNERISLSTILELTKKCHWRPRDNMSFRLKRSVMEKLNNI